jgi:hypothetical protein
MAALLARIQQHAYVSALVASVLATATITLTARTPGVWGDGITTTATGGITAGAATLASGANATLDSAGYHQGDYVGLTA